MNMHAQLHNVHIIKLARKICCMHEACELHPAPNVPTSGPGLVKLYARHVEAVGSTTEIHLQRNAWLSRIPCDRLAH